MTILLQLFHYRFFVVFQQFGGFEVCIKKSKTLCVAYFYPQEMWCKLQNGHLEIPELPKFWLGDFYYKLPKTIKRLLR